MRDARPLLDDHHAHRGVLPENFAQSVGHFGRDLDPREAAADDDYRIARRGRGTFSKRLQVSIERNCGIALVYAVTKVCEARDRGLKSVASRRDNQTIIGQHFGRAVHAR